MRMSAFNQVQDEIKPVGTTLSWDATTETFACEINLISASAMLDPYIGCSILSRTEVNPTTVTSRFFEFLLTPNSDVFGGQAYELVLTSAQPYKMDSTSSYTVHGILFPSEPYTYKLELSTCEACASGTSGFLQWQHGYFPVYGVAFKSFEVISYISIPGEWNIFTVNLQLTLAVDNTLERLIIELPTVNLS